jgi:hypothetical protein
MPDKYDMELDARPDISWKHQSNCPECGSENMSWIEVRWRDYKSIENEVYDNTERLLLIRLSLMK